jgi:hypothetical protein
MCLVMSDSTLVGLASCKFNFVRKCKAKNQSVQNQNKSRSKQNQSVQTKNKSHSKQKSKCTKLKQKSFNLVKKKGETRKSIETCSIISMCLMMSDSTLVHFASLQLQLLSVRAKQKIKVYQLETTKSDVAHLIQLLSLLIGIF